MPKQPTEREITGLSDLAESVNGSANGSNRGVYALCEDGARHKINGVVDLDGTVYGATYVGWLAIESATVLEDE